MLCSIFKFSNLSKLNKSKLSVLVYLFMQNTCKYISEETKLFCLIKHQVNKVGISRRWCTEADGKNFKSGVLRTIRNITRSMVN